MLVERLAQKAGAAGLCGGAHLRIQIVGRQNHDGRPRITGLRSPNRACVDGLVAIQSRHVNVHQDDIEAVRLHHIERFQAIPRTPDQFLLQKNSGQHKTLIGVFGHQNAEAGPILLGRAPLGSLDRCRLAREAKPPAPWERAASLTNSALPPERTNALPGHQRGDAVEHFVGVLKVYVVRIAVQPIGDAQARCLSSQV